MDWFTKQDVRPCLLDKNRITELYKRKPKGSGGLLFYSPKSPFIFPIPKGGVLKGDKRFKWGACFDRACP